MTQARNDNTQAILASLADNIGQLTAEVSKAVTKIERVDEKVNNLTFEVAVVKEQVKALGARLDDTNTRIDKRLDDTNERIDTRINDLTKRIDDTNSRMEKLEQRFNIQSSWFLGIFGTLVAGLLIFLGRLVFFTAVS